MSCGTKSLNWSFWVFDRDSENICPSLKRSQDEVPRRVQVSPHMANSNPRNFTPNSLNSGSNFAIILSRSVDAGWYPVCDREQLSNRPRPKRGWSFGGNRACMMKILPPASSHVALLLQGVPSYR